MKVRGQNCWLYCQAVLLWAGRAGYWSSFGDRVSKKKEVHRGSRKVGFREEQVSGCIAIKTNLPDIWRGMEQILFARCLPRERLISSTMFVCTWVYPLGLKDLPHRVDKQQHRKEDGSCFHGMCVPSNKLQWFRWKWCHLEETWPVKVTQPMGNSACMVDADGNLAHQLLNQSYTCWNSVDHFTHT